MRSVPVAAFSGYILESAVMSVLSCSLKKKELFVKEVCSYGTQPE